MGGGGGGEQGWAGRQDDVHTNAHSEWSFRTYSFVCGPRSYTHNLTQLKPDKYCLGNGAKTYPRICTIIIHYEVTVLLSTLEHTRIINTN